MQQTSLNAYELFKSKKITDQNAILNVLKFNDNLTYSEIAQNLRWANYNKVSRRTKELIELNKIEVTGSKICTVAKSRCMTYKLVEPK